jgi:hypothetical protein
MNLAIEAHIASQSKSVQSCLQQACRDDLNMDDLFYSLDYRAIARRNSLICELANGGMSVTKIMEITKQDHNYIIRVLSWRKIHEQPIKTARWL